MMEDDVPQLSRPGEMAVLLGISTRALCELAKAGLIPYYYVGPKCFRYDHRRVLAVFGRIPHQGSPAEGMVPDVG